MLVGFTVIVPASVGAGVLLFQDDSPDVTANFSYQYMDQTSKLLITFERGQEVPADSLVVSGPDENVTWGVLANEEANRTVDPGSVVQAGRGNA